MKLECDSFIVASLAVHRTLEYTHILPIDPNNLAGASLDQPLEVLNERAVFGRICQECLEHMHGASNKGIKVARIRKSPLIHLDRCQVGKLAMAPEPCMQLRCRAGIHCTVIDRQDFHLLSAKTDSLVIAITSLVISILTFVLKIWGEYSTREYAKLGEEVIAIQNYQKAQAAAQAIKKAKAALDEASLKVTPHIRESYRPCFETKQDLDYADLVMISALEPQMLTGLDKAAKTAVSECVFKLEEERSKVNIS